MGWLGRIIGIVIVLVIVLMIVKDPQKSADFVVNLLTGIGNFFRAIWVRLSS